MFEDELEMEKRTSNWLPLVLILLLAAAVVGAIGYYVYQIKTGKLTPDQAATIISSSLKTRTAMLRFHSGTVTPSVNEKPTDPHYRLLEKAGLVKVANGKGMAKLISLTSEGEKLFTSFPEFQKASEPDGTTLYQVPLADRKLVGVTSVTMNGLSQAVVEYTWKWEPTKLGDLFDANGTTFNTMASWDRATLIQKYGGDFYHGDAAKAAVRMVKGDKGWQIAE